MNVKTVQSCNGQKEMTSRYAQSLQKARIHGILIGLWQGLFDGIFYFVLYVFFAIGFVYGGYLYYHGLVEAGNVISINNMMMMSFYFVGAISPHLMAVFNAKVSAAIIYKQIEKVKCFKSLFIFCV